MIKTKGVTRTYMYLIKLKD